MTFKTESPKCSASHPTVFQKNTFGNKFTDPLRVPLSPLSVAHVFIYFPNVKHFERIERWQGEGRKEGWDGGGGGCGYLS